jgi:HEAT repeat protein
MDPMRCRIPLLAAVVMLGSSCGPRTPEVDYSTLIKKLSSNDELVRGKATTDLITIGEPAVPAIVPLLSDPEARIRRIAATTLWGMGEKARAAVPQLAAALGDSDASVRASAAMALGGIGPEAREAVPALIGVLRDRDGNVRLWAVKALGQMGPAAARAVPSLKRMAKDEFLGPAVEEAIRKLNAEAATQPTPGRRRRRR